MNWASLKSNEAYKRSQITLAAIQLSHHLISEKNSELRTDNTYYGETGSRWNLYLDKSTFSTFSQGKWFFSHVKKDKIRGHDVNGNKLTMGPVSCGKNLIVHTGR